MRLQLWPALGSQLRLLPGPRRVSPLQLGLWPALGSEWGSPLQLGLGLGLPLWPKPGLPLPPKPGLRSRHGFRLWL